MTISEISSAVYNHVFDGLHGISNTIKISLEQLADEVVAERNQIMREYLLKGVMNLEEQFLAINCVEVSCDYMSKCCNVDLPVGEKALHFEIPPIIYLHGRDTIKFIGSIDRKVKYNVYTDEAYRFHKYRKRGADSPYVYVDTAINSNGMLDCYIFNVPFVKYISVVALFQDPRKLLEFSCCSGDEDTYTDMGILSDEIIKRLTQKYIMWHRQAEAPITPNNQQPK